MVQRICAIVFFIFILSLHSCRKENLGANIPCIGGCFHLQGTIYDAQTGTPLTGATVYINECREPNTWDLSGLASLFVPSINPPIGVESTGNNGYYHFRLQSEKDGVRICYRIYVKKGKESHLEGVWAGEEGEVVIRDLDF